MTDQELFNLCKKYGSNALMWRRKFEALLPEVSKRKLYLKHGFHSIFEFAAKLGGVSNRAVEEVLRLTEKVKEKPLLKKQIEIHGWSKVRAVTPLLETEKEEDLVDMVKTMPKRAIEKTVHHLKKSTPGCKISFDLDPETELKLRSFKQKLEKARKRPVSFNETLKELLKNETATKCTTCNNPAEENHHPTRQAIEKTNTTVPLCRPCHQVAHSSRIKNETKDPSTWRFTASPALSTAYPIDKKVQKYWQLC